MRLGQMYERILNDPKQALTEYENMLALPEETVKALYPVEYARSYKDTVRYVTQSVQILRHAQNLRTNPAITPEMESAQKPNGKPAIIPEVKK
jgi:hypothetical protein